MSRKSTYEELQQRVKTLEQKTEKLKRTETELVLKRQVFELSITANSTSDLEGIITHVNRAFIRTWRYETKKEAVGKPIRDFLKFENEAMKIITALKETGEWQGEYTAIRKDGTTFVAYGLATIIKDKSGKDIGYQSAILDISDQKQTQETLMQSEERFRTAFDNAAVGMALMANDGYFMKVNQALCKILGYSEKELQGKTWIEITEPNDLAGCFDWLKRIKAGEKSSHEKRFIHKLGHPVWIEVSSSAVCNSQGQIQYYISLFQDIDARKRSEKKLKERESTLKSIFLAAPIGIGMVANRIIKHANDRLCEMLGYFREELLDKSARILYPTDEDFEYVGREKYAQINEQGTGTVETFWQRKDGQIIDVLLCSTAIDPNDLSGDVIFTALDITESKQTEKEQILLSTAVKEASENIIISDKRGTIQYINPSFEKLSGFAQEDIIGQNFRILKSNKHNETFYEEMYDSISRGKIWQGRITNKMKDGSLREFETIISPVRDRSGEIINYVSVNRDVTQEVALEAQLRQSQKMEAVGMLAGGIAHDFNNLLTTIIGYADFVADDVRNNASLCNDINEIRKAGRQAAALTGQLLAFSRKQLIQPEIIDLNDILEDTEKMLSRTIGEDIELKMMVEHELWDVKIDPEQIKQMLMNLAVNARDAMPHGGKLTFETVNVAVDKAYLKDHGVEIRPGSYVMMTISDTGMGIDEEIQSRIFEPFFTTKERGRGTGLGLSTVYGIVKQNNGHIWVYSEPGKGTTFKVYLPRTKIDKIPCDKAILDENLINGSETILVVEDSEALLKMTQKMLTKYGYRVLTANSAIEAMKIFNGNDVPIHLLLTDVVMPKMSGRELAEQIQSKYPEIQVVYMSGYTDSVIAHHGVLDKSVHFIQKPFSSNDLVRKVRNVLEN